MSFEFPVSMLRCAAAVLFGLCLLACDDAAPRNDAAVTPDAGGGGGGVVYNVACNATCPSTGVSSTFAASACDVDGLDPTILSADGVDQCVVAGEGGCPDIICTCAVERTSTPCTP